MACENQKILNEITCDQPCHIGGSEYCILKEMILHDSKYNDRLVIQSACVNKYKFDISKIKDYDVGWREAWKMWVENGFATKFAICYRDGIGLKEIYRNIMA